MKYNKLFVTYILILISMILLLIFVTYANVDKGENIKLTETQQFNCSYVINNQCLDENSLFYGCNLEDKFCYNYCKK